MLPSILKLPLLSSWELVEAFSCLLVLDCLDLGGEIGAARLDGGVVLRSLARSWMWSFFSLDLNLLVIFKAGSPPAWTQISFPLDVDEKLVFTCTGVR